MVGVWKLEILRKGGMGTIEVDCVAPGIPWKGVERNIRRGSRRNNVHQGSFIIASSEGHGCKLLNDGQSELIISSRFFDLEEGGSGRSYWRSKSCLWSDQCQVLNFIQHASFNVRSDGGKFAYAISIKVSGHARGHGTNLFETRRSRMDPCFSDI